jgi:dihydrofolate reductase
MTQVIYYTATTLDGYLADERDSLDWLFVQDIDRDGPLSYDRFIAGIGAIVMGRTTFEWLRRHMESSSEKWSYSIPAFVFTHAELSAPSDADIRFVQGSVAAVHHGLVEAASGKDVWIVGGGDLAAQFAEEGLLDELRLSIAPVTLGAGRPLFPRKFDLELKSLERNHAFVCATYALVGARKSSEGNDRSGEPL